MKKVAKSQKPKRKKLGWPEWTLIGMVAVATMAIGVALCTLIGDGPAEKADKELAKLANDYYVEYLYPRLLGSKMNEDPAATMKIYDEIGVPTTYLRQLLHYNNDEKIGSAGVFSAVACDTNMTGVRYYPYAPYGPNDYKIEYIWKCDKK